jgi:hypothetical protein
MQRYVLPRWYKSIPRYGGRRMNLEEAIDILENVIADEVIGIYCLEIQKEVECSKNCENEDCFLQQAIDTVLKELHTLQMNYKLLEEKFDGSAEEKVDKLTEELQTRYNKGYQDGFKQAKFDCEMDKLDGR